MTRVAASRRAPWSVGALARGRPSRPLAAPAAAQAGRATSASPARARRGRPAPSTPCASTSSSSASPSTTTRAARRAGRKNFLNGTVDFAASDIPFQFHPEDGSAPENPAPGSYAYIPVTAGGTSFMYNLKINGQRVTNLRLSGENVAKIFTGVDHEVERPGASRPTTPGSTLPARKIVPVVRSDGSGSSAQFTRWMINQHGGDLERLLPTLGPGAGLRLHVVLPDHPRDDRPVGRPRRRRLRHPELRRGRHRLRQLLVRARRRSSRWPRCSTRPATTPSRRRRTSPCRCCRRGSTPTRAPPTTSRSSSTASTPTPTPATTSSRRTRTSSCRPRSRGQFNEEKGKTLGAFAYYAMCQAQQQSASLGYSPMPINLVEASFDQIRKIPGVEVQNIDIAAVQEPDVLGRRHQPARRATRRMPPGVRQAGARPSARPARAASVETTPTAAGGGRRRWRAVAAVGRRHGGGGGAAAPAGAGERRIGAARGAGAGRAPRRCATRRPAAAARRRMRTALAGRRRRRHSVPWRRADRARGGSRAGVDADARPCSSSLLTLALLVVPGDRLAAARPSTARPRRRRPTTGSAPMSARRSSRPVGCRRLCRA